MQHLKHYLEDPVRHLIRRPLQALAAILFIASFRILPFAWASGLGGFIARNIGPKLKISNKARNNIKMVFPEKTEAEIEKIIHGMWDNLGRLAGEYYHLPLLFKKNAHRVDVIGEEHIDSLRDDGKPGFFYSAHMGNWEIASFYPMERGIALHRIYRDANNPLTAWLMRLGRDKIPGELLPKGSPGAKRAFTLMRKGEHLAIMVDQKSNDGIPVPLFGRDAMTAPFMAKFAIKFKCPVVPALVVRTNGANFRFTFYPPIYAEDTGDYEKDVYNFMLRVHQILEEWIKENPEQWLWLHRRWPD